MFKTNFSGHNKIWREEIPLNVPVATGLIVLNIKYHRDEQNTLKTTTAQLTTTKNPHFMTAEESNIQLWNSGIL